MNPTMQDFILPLLAQRDAALNEVVNLRAEIAALRRENDGLKRERADRGYRTSPGADEAAKLYDCNG